MLVIVTVLIGEPMPTATCPKSTGLGSAVSAIWSGCRRRGGCRGWTLAGDRRSVVVVVVVLVVGGGVNDDEPVSVLVVDTASFPNSETVMMPLVVLLLFGAAYRTLTVHVAPGGRNMPPTHDPPPGS